MSTPLLWLVDDTEHWHAVTRATLAQLDAPPRFESFHSATAALMCWRDRCANGELPACVLMDFFLGDARGDEVARAFRAEEPDDHHAIIVGHSTVIDCSERIRHVADGVVVRKHAGPAGTNPSLYKWLVNWLA